MNHELGQAYNHSLVTKQNYIENKNKQTHSASGLYYAIVGNVDVYNRAYDRYHVLIPELNNAYYQNVPRKHDFVSDSGGTLSSTLSQGDSVLISFEAGKFDNPIIVGSQFFTGDPSNFISAANKGTLDKMPNVVLPPTSQGEAIKAMSQSGGNITVKTKDTNEPDTSNIRSTLKGNVVVGLEVFNKSSGLKTNVSSSKEVIVTNGSKYENVTGKQYSVAEGLTSKGKEEVANLSISLQEQLQKYPTTNKASSSLDITYVSSDQIVPGQVVVNSNGEPYQYNTNASSSSSQTLIKPDGSLSSYTTSTSTKIDYDKVNKRLTVVNDILKTSKQQDKYEQEVLLPCVENIKNVWNQANYLLSNDFSFSKPKFSLSYLCNLGSIKLKASFPPIGSIEQQIDYCAPSWLSVPLLIVKGLYDLGCSNAWKTDFLTKFTSDVNNQASLMICCDDNGLPNIGFNIASSIDIGSAFAISGAPIPLRDPGVLPNSVTIRPSANTTINLNAPDIIRDRYTKELVKQKDSNNNTINDSDYYPNVANNNLQEPQYNKPEIANVYEPENINTTIEEPYNDQLDIPLGLVAYDTPITHLSLELPLPSYSNTPYRINKNNTQTDSPYLNLETLFVNYGIPQPELLLSELKYLALTKSTHNFFQIMALVSQRPLVKLTFCLLNVFIQGDLNLNQYIYKSHIKKDIPSNILTLFKFASEGDLSNLNSYISSYFGVDMDFISWIYNPLSILDWVVIQEVQLQPLYVSLYNGSIDEFCVLLVRVFNGVNLKLYESLYKNFTSLCIQALNLPNTGANFYGGDMVKVFVPQIQQL